MTFPLALNQYLVRLDLTVPDSLSLDFVCELQRRHVAEFSFNNLAVVLGDDISLDLDDVSEKIVTRGLGGYCFEHNKLTFELLKALGYDVQLKLARVLNNNLERAVGRTHRVTLLTLNNEMYLIDTGFGGNGPLSPLSLSTQQEQQSGFEHYRMLPLEGGEWDLQIVKDGDYFTLYRFDFAHYSEADCTVGHFYSHRHPNAVFVNNLMVTNKALDKTRSLLNSTFNIKTESGEQSRKVDSPRVLQSILAEHFQIKLELVVAEHLFERFVQSELDDSQTRS